MDILKEKRSLPQGTDNSKTYRSFKDGVIRVGTPGDYIPFSFYKGNILSGIDIDILKDFSSSSGLDLHFIPTTWRDLMNDLLEGKFNMAVGGISISKERRKKALFSATYFRTGKAPLTLRERAHFFGSLKDIDKPGVRVIVNPGGTNEIFARKMLKRAEVIVHKNNLTVFNMIMDGSVDLMITDAVEAMVWEQKCPELKAVNPRKPLTCSRFAFLIGPGEKKLKSELDRWLVSYGRNGGIKRTIFNWTGKEL